VNLELTVLHAARADAGYIGGFAITEHGMFAAGGTSADVPTVMMSADAHGFERCATPRELGLRDVISVGDSLWLCGEYGQLAQSRDRGASWRTVDTGTDVCLFALALAADGVMWVVGDGGYAARVHADGIERVDFGTTVRLSRIYPLGDHVIALCGDGAIRSWREGRVEKLATGATRILSGFAQSRRGTWVVVGDGGFISRSPDGAWFARAASGVDVDLEAIAVIADGRLVAVGDRGYVLVSADDGRTWKSLPTEVEAHLWSIEPFGDGALIGGDGGWIGKLGPPGAAASAFEQLVRARQLDGSATGLVAAFSGVAADASYTELLFNRSRWICALLANDDVEEAAALFLPDLNQPVPADQLDARLEACEQAVPTALYALWRAFFLDEPELPHYLELARVHDAMLVRDAARLVDELRGGRNDLGAIADVRARVAAFRAHMTAV
jgi:hypothetical protein